MTQRRSYDTWRVTPEEKEHYHPTRPYRQTGASKRSVTSAREKSATRQSKSPVKGVSKAPEGEKKATSDRSSRYIPSLDGLRALAVLAVVAYHLDFSWAKGGLLGVTVFFVLSGYLITSLLVIEFDRSGTINLPHFWLRRIRRLVPAILTVIICCAALFTLFNHVLLTKMRPDIIPSLFFYNNWWQILRDVSYFEALGSPSPLAHFWSLAIEEQFYLVWPILLLAVFKLNTKRIFIRRGILVLTAISVLAMALLYVPGADPSRVYYGTDTRAFSLLLGAWLALFWPSSQLGNTLAVKVSKAARNVLDSVGLVALVALLLMFIFADGYATFLYRGGIFLVSILSAILIAVLVHPASMLARLFGLAPLMWIGKRSYGIYLWHYPLILLFTPSTGQTPWWLLLIELVVIFIASALSYRFIEDPIRKGALRQRLRSIRKNKTTLRATLRSHVVPTFVGAVICIIALLGIIFVPDTSSLDEEGAELLKNEDAQTAGLSEDSQNQNVLDVLLIGDSVSVRAIPYYQEAFPYGAIDAQVNRQLTAGAEVYEEYEKQGIVGDVVVFALGTNGPATDKQLDNLIAVVGSKKNIFFINTRSDKDWVETTNAALETAAQRYSFVSIIDWYSLSADHSDYFDGDGTHLNVQGAQAYTQMIYDAISYLLPEHDEDDVNALDERYAEVTAKTKTALASANVAIQSFTEEVATSFTDNLAISQKQEEKSSE